MKVLDVRVGQKYLYRDREVEVLKKIPGRLTVKPNIQSGILFTGYKRQQKKFLLSSGDRVYACELRKHHR